MIRRTRTFLFFSLAVLFLVITPLTVFYSLGWRMDWQEIKIIQPGAFYFKVWPKNCYIYLDEKLAKKTDFLFGTAFVDNLPAKNYEVEIKKEGFQIWEKNLEIKERGITSAKNIILFPEKLNLEVVSKSVERFFFSPDKKKIILQESINSNSENSDASTWVLKLFEIDKNIKSHLFEEKDITKEEAELIDLQFSPDSKRILLTVKVKEPLKTTKSGEKNQKESVADKLKYYFADLDKTLPTPSFLTDFSKETKEVYFSQQNPQKLLFLEAGVLAELNLVNYETSPPILENIITFSISNGGIYYLDKSGFLFRANPSFQQREKLNLSPFPVKTESQYKIFALSSYIFLKEDNVLYQFKKEKNGFEKLSEPVKDFGLSPDLKKLVFFSDYEIQVLFLEEIFDQPYKKANSQLFLTRFSEKINKVFWLAHQYLVFNTGNKIKIVELDDRDKINIFNLGEFENPEIFWNQTTKKLYIFAKKTLYESEKLAP